MTYNRIFFIFFITFITLSLDARRSFCQQIPFSPRDNIIFTTLNQVREREDALGQAMDEAQIRILEEELVGDKKKEELISEKEERHMAMDEVRMLILEEELVKIKEKQLEEGEAKPVKEKKWSIDFGRFASRFHPYLSETVELDDNIDSLSTGKKSRLTNTNKVGLKANFIGRGRSLDLDMYAQNKHYKNKPSSNTLDGNGSITSHFKVGRYVVSLADTYFSNRLSAKDLGVDDDDDATNYWSNTGAFKLARSFNHTGFDVGYKRAEYGYEPIAKRSNNKFTETYSFGSYLLIARKTKLLYDYTHERTKYKHVSSSDSFYNDYNLTLTGSLSSKLTDSLKIGYKLTDDNSDDDTRVTTLKGTVGYMASTRSNFSFSLKHTINEEATKSDYNLSDEFTLSANRRLAFNPKFNLSFEAKAKYDEYPKRESFPNPQKDQTYTFGAGLKYAFRNWINFSLDYTYKKFNSNVDSEYYKNTYTFKSEARF